MDRSIYSNPIDPDGGEDYRMGEDDREYQPANDRNSPPSIAYGTRS